MCYLRIKKMPGGQNERKMGWELQCSLMFTDLWGILLFVSQKWTSHVSDLWRHSIQRNETEFHSPERSRKPRKSSILLAASWEIWSLKRLAQWFWFVFHFALGLCWFGPLSACFQDSLTKDTKLSPLLSEARAVCFYSDRSLAADLGCCKTGF